MVRNSCLDAFEYDTKYYCRKETNAALAASLHKDYVPTDKFTQLEQVVDALGKAINAMPSHGENSDKAENISPLNNKKSMTPDAK